MSQQLIIRRLVPYHGRQRLPSDLRRPSYELSANLGCPIQPVANQLEPRAGIGARKYWSDNPSRRYRLDRAAAAMPAPAEQGGVWFGLVALIADGLHMSTHAGALLIAAFAYTYSHLNPLRAEASRAC